MTSSTDTSDKSEWTTPERLKIMKKSRVLDKVGEALARLGRVKRVGLTVKDKPHL